jgi:hypothetical protein
VTILVLASCKDKHKDIIIVPCFTEITSVEVSGAVQDNYSLPRNVQVTADGQPVTVDIDGNFLHTVDMTAKSNAEIMARDEALPENSVSAKVNVR